MNVIKKEEMKFISGGFSNIDMGPLKIDPIFSRQVEQGIHDAVTPIYITDKPIFTLPEIQVPQFFADVLSFFGIKFS
ncbi:hypothetical protein [Erwinia sp. 9145]|uniref:hypothetical protein n=1 Tax=Erwinia sp. 9145 TaxID=1500895 RepID=UPI000556B802|nr:hypothetical protein [Erwinia sp. 9145]